MSNCDIDMILQLTNIFETSNPSAGIIQFTTGAGSAQEVIEEYTAINHPNEFTTMNSTLDAIKKNYLQTKDLNGDVNGPWHPNNLPFNNVKFNVQLGLEGTKDLVKRTGRLPESINANAELKWLEK
ncbi:hypothetical protein HDV02_003678 [Globomyces sp. JEL0801]|nr:hypothetical protein HDV02_003678 [Globomyces sp. JEL0801]